MTDSTLRRAVPFTVTRAHDDGADGLTLEGYAAVFDSPTEINSWEGHFIETIAPGAFRKTLAERSPVLQFDHGSHPLIGSLPLGVIQRAAEDDRGLFVRARLSDNWLIQPVRDAIADGAVDGMSFRFSVPSGKDTWEYPDEGPPNRTIREVKLFELGPVVFPAYQETTVGVRAEFENALIRDVQEHFDTRTEQPGDQPTAGNEPSSHDEEPARATPRISESERRRIAAKIRGVKHADSSSD